MRVLGQFTSPWLARARRISGYARPTCGTGSPLGQKFCGECGSVIAPNRPFAEEAMFRRVKGKALPDWAAAVGCASWAQFFLKWILAQPAVTCVIPGTRNPTHVADNLGAAAGPLPDEAMRRKMSGHFASL